MTASQLSPVHGINPTTRGGNDELAERRREKARAERDEAIRRRVQQLVAEAPPFTPGQMARLAILLSDDGNAA
jgi:hypothetical protein